MAMNGKKGQLFLVGLALFVIAVIFIVITMPVLKSMFTEAASVGNMDCGNSSISDAEKASCIFLDWTSFYWFVGALGAAAVFLTWKWGTRKQG